MSLYTTEVLKLATGLRAERLKGAEVTVSKRSRVCGSTVSVDVKIRDGRISAFGTEVKACALGQASTAIVEKQAPGKDLKEIAGVRKKLEKLLAGEDVRFPRQWRELQVFKTAVKHKGRHSAILLPFLALEEAFLKP